ncbi:hypothetical protein MRB53_012826 [Persea americana]|uniref:Uncharacterized protein n=1 Tax=Persea americana TaxID=3435 RepID=A0ACC2LYN7_PERAE|nr:hypothetical protein MRB53_012826 [Persea americana]
MAARNACLCFAFLFTRSDLARGPPSIYTVVVSESSPIVFRPRYLQQDLPATFLFSGGEQGADVRQQSRSTGERKSRPDLNETDLERLLSLSLICLCRRIWILRSLTTPSSQKHPSLFFTENPGLLPMQIRPISASAGIPDPAAVFGPLT